MFGCLQSFATVNNSAENIDEYTSLCSDAGVCYKITSLHEIAESKTGFSFDKYCKIASGVVNGFTHPLSYIIRVHVSSSPCQQMNYQTFGCFPN